MTPETIRLVQDSWAQVRPMADAAGALFYRHLFTADATLRPLFRGDMTAQARRLVQMMDAAVRGLDDLPTLLPVLHQLGTRHAGYGVRPRDYDTVGDALLETLAQGLGDDAFTPDVRAAWVAVYAALAAAMQAPEVRPRSGAALA